MSTIGIFARAPRFRATLLLGLCLLPVVTQAQTGGPALVRVATAEVKNIAPVTMVPGTVISRDDAQLSAEVPGRLIEVLDGDDLVILEARGTFDGNLVGRLDDNVDGPVNQAVTATATPKLDHTPATCEFGNPRQSVACLPRAIFWRT